MLECQSMLLFRWHGPRLRANASQVSYDCDTHTATRVDNKRLIEDTWQVHVYSIYGTTQCWYVQSVPEWMRE